MENSEYFILLMGMGAVTFVPRWLPMFFLSGKKLPQWFVDWLDLIPVAILSALLLPALVISGDPRHLEIFQPKLFVAIPTFLFALKTRSLAGTVVVGMGLYWFAERFIV
jgi:branched-subunit amino acid transport protein